MEYIGYYLVKASHDSSWHAAEARFRSIDEALENLWAYMSMDLVHPICLVSTDATDFLAVDDILAELGAFDPEEGDVT